MKVAILGTGNIGTDLLVKLLRIKEVDVVAFVGRRLESDGIRIAENLGVNVSILGIDYFIKNENCCQLVFDCTNAQDARNNYHIFRQQGIIVVDMTPAKIGKMCVPDINISQILYEKNINMVTCGGQASIPIIRLVSENCKKMKYVQVVSQISSKSAGMSTRINIDDYIETTQKAIKLFTECENVKVILNLNPAIPQVDMQTTMFIQLQAVNVLELKQKIINKITRLKQYIPNYQLIIYPVQNQQGVLIISVKVRGSGDYLPPYSGNLDIINCAAIKVMKEIMNVKHNNRV